MIRKFTFTLILLSCCTWVWCPLAKAQTPNLTISLVGYTLDTVNLGYTLTLDAEISNPDTTPFAGHINFGLGTSNGVITNSGVFEQPPYSGDSIYIQPGGTVPAFFGVHISQQYFAPGPDVVVVWPICTAPAGDSIIHAIFVRDPSAVNGTVAGLFSYTVMPDKIVFSGLEPNLSFERVRIYDVLGREVMALNEPSISQIPTGQLIRGVYICRLIANDGRSFNFKFYAQ